MPTTIRPLYLAGYSDPDWGQLPDLPAGLAGTVFFVAVLDGSDVYAHCHGDAAQPKESLHRQFVRHAASKYQGRIHCVDDDESWYRDAEFATFDRMDPILAGINTAVTLIRQADAWNAEHSLNWEHQIHSRMALTTASWRETLRLLSQAQRGELLIDAADWQTLPAETRRAVEPMLSVRHGISQPAWDEIVREIDTGEFFEELAGVAVLANK